MSYRGDFYLGSNVDFKFSSIDAGIPTSVSGSFVAVYGSNSVSEITAGITLTPDFDSRVGLNHVRVAATIGNGFAAATDYEVVMISGTVGGKSIAGYVLGSFSLQNRYNDITGTYPFANLVNLDAAVSTRSSHSAADVWTSGTRTLTSFGTLVADIWANATRTLTAFSDSSGVTTLLSRIGGALNISGGKVESNIKQVNDTNITGDGSGGNPWGPV